MLEQDKYIFVTVHGPRKLVILFDDRGITNQDMLPTPKINHKVCNVLVNAP